MLDRIASALMKRMNRLQARAAELSDTPPPAGAAQTTAVADDFEDSLAAGNAAVGADDAAGAEAHYRRAIAARPEHVGALVNLGYVLAELQRFGEARVYYQRALRANPADPSHHETHFLLGQAAEAEGQFAQAGQHFGHAVALKPDFVQAVRDGCRVLFLAGQPDAARALLAQGLQQCPGHPDLLFYQGNLQTADLAPKAAADSYLQAIAQGMDTPQVHESLGAALYRLGRADEGLQSYQRAQALDPGVAQRQYLSGSRLLAQGDTAAAMLSFDLALALEPGLLKAYSNLLVCLSIGVGAPPARYAQVAARYGARLSQMAQPFERSTPPWLSALAPRPPLRVGFVSGDFKAHPVGFFLEGILRALDPQRISPIAYANLEREDAVSARLKTLFLEWYDIHALSDEAAAQLIHRHRLDVLVDLAGHTETHRLPVFAWRAAPVQVSWLGYFASTGVAEIDYLLADEAGAPPDSTEYFSEKLWYLPDTRLCLTPPALAWPVSPAPALRAEHITFGCYQALNKITPAVLALWAQVLKSVPHARLRLQVPQFGNAEVRAQMLRALAALGVDEVRVSLHAGVPWEDYLQSYQEVDLLLDTFPYPGGTTTAEALWMGVPTLTLCGHTMLSRQGAGMMGCVGLHDWVAHSEAEYLEKARAFATDIPALATLRQSLRARALASPLFDTQRFAGHLTDALEGMVRAAAQQR